MIAMRTTKPRRTRVAARACEGEPPPLPEGATAVRTTKPRRARVATREGYSAHSPGWCRTPPTRATVRSRACTRPSGSPRCPAWSGPYPRRRSTACRRSRCATAGCRRRCPPCPRASTSGRGDGSARGAAHHRKVTQKRDIGVARQTTHNRWLAAGGCVGLRVEVASRRCCPARRGGGAEGARPRCRSTRTVEDITPQSKLSTIQRAYSGCSLREGAAAPALTARKRITARSMVERACFLLRQGGCRNKSSEF